MLLAIRDKATGWVAYIFIGLITIPFALWGLGEYFGGAGPLVAAEVNGTDIPVRAVQDEARSQRERLRSAFGGSLPDDLDDAALRAQALESLIDREVIEQAVQGIGLRVGEDAVLREIRAIPAFQDNGRFSAQQYRLVLDNQRIAASDFERDIARSLRLAQFEQALTASSVIPANEAQRLAGLAGQERVIRYRTFPASDVASDDVVTDEAIAAYYEEQAERFALPARVRVAYLRLDPGQVDGDIRLSEDDVREHFELTRERFTEPELRTVRQILVASDAHDDAEARARKLRQRIDDGETFADVAQDASDDASTASRGGNLGQVARGELSAAQDTVVFSLPEGLVSQPVRSDRGWLILEVAEITPPQTAAFDSVRDEVEADLRDRRAEQRQIELLDALLAQSFEHPDTLEPAAAATGLEIRTSDWFSRDRGDGIAAQRAVRNAAFSPAVRNDGRNSEAVDLADGSTVVLRIEDEEPEAQRPLDEVRGEIVEALRGEAVRRATREAAEAERDRLAASGSSDRLDEAYGWEGPVNVVRRATDGDSPVVRSVRDSVFRMAPPESGGVEWAVQPLADGSSILLALEAVEPGAEAEPVDDVRRSLQRERAALEIDALVEALRESTEIKRYPENLE